MKLGNCIINRAENPNCSILYEHKANPHNFETDTNFTRILVRSPLNYEYEYSEIRWKLKVPTILKREDF